jgi:hypothetical protein
MRRLPARVAILVAAMFLTVGVAAWALAVRENGPDISPRPEAERPALMLLTTLPLVFPEEFSLQGGGSKALTALETRYRVVPIATTDAKSLGQGRMLMLAHPLAQPAETLVDLDRWVRDGGRVLLLADPRLEWPSSRPLGDKLRPPPSFADTGLLAHWGLKLEPPAEAGPAHVIRLLPCHARRLRRALFDRRRKGDRRCRRRLPEYRTARRPHERQSRRTSRRTGGTGTLSRQ